MPLETTTNSSRKAMAVLACVAMLFGATLFWSIAKWGVGVRPDSIKYLSVAENMQAGKGFIRFDGQRQFQVTPLYPGILCVFRMVGWQPESAIGWMNAILYGCTGFLIGYMVYRFCRSLWLAIFAMVVLLASPPVIVMFVELLTEPVFFVLAALGILWMARYLQAPTWANLIIASVGLSLAVFSRYAASSIIPAAMLAVCLMARTHWGRRVVHVAILTPIVALPLGIWHFVNRPLEAHGGVGLGIKFSGSWSWAMKEAINFLGALSQWWIPQEFPKTVRACLLGVSLVAFVSLGVALWRRRGSNTGTFDAGPYRRLPQWIGLYLAVFTATMVGIVAFLRPDMFFGSRLQAPIFVFGVPMVLCSLYRRFHQVDAGPFLRGLCIAACVVLACCQVGRGLLRFADIRKDGVPYSYTSRAFRESRVIAHLRAMDRPELIYSCHVEGLWYLTGVPDSRKIPTLQTDTGQKIANFEALLAAVQNGLRKPGAYLVYCRPEGRAKYPSESFLRQELPLVPVADFEDGAIYQLARPATQQLSRPAAESSPSSP